MQPFRFFRTPHPFIFNAYSVLVPSMVTVLLIVLLAPRQFQHIPFFERSLIALAMGALVAGTIWLAVSGLKRCLPHLIEEEGWTIGREVVLYLVVVGVIDLVIFFALAAFSSTSEPLAWQLGRTTLYTLGLGLFPIIILILFEQYQYQQRQARQAYRLTELLRAENQTLQLLGARRSAVSGHLQLKAENGKVELQLYPDEVLCIRSAGNYVEVFYCHQDTCQVKLIRNKLKYFSSSLPIPPFFRCHNRFVVNGTHIVRVEGNARDLELSVRGLDFSVPVSRTKAASFEAFLVSLSARS